MLNMLCASFAENIQLCLIVVVIGIGMVFIILAMLIGVVQLLKYVNDGLNVWDDMMYYVRKKKAEKKVIVNSLKEHKASDIADIKIAKSDKKITKEDAKAQIIARKEKYQEDKALSLNIIAEIKSKYAEAKLVNVDTSSKISAMKQAEKAEFNTAMSTVSSPGAKAELKTARISKLDAMSKEIKSMRAAAKAAMNAIIEASEVDDSEMEVQYTNNDEIIAAITAAIAIVTANESVARKVTFKVRSIKEVR